MGGPAALGRLCPPGVPESAAIFDRVTLLADVAELVSRSHDLDETLSNVVDLVAKRLDADVCSVYLASSDFRFLTLSATKGLHGESVGRVQLAFGEGLVGRAADRREPVVIEQAQEHPQYKYFPETGEEAFASLMAAPLMVRGVPIGVLTVQTRVARKFDDADVHILKTCAQLIAPVVVNAQLLATVGQSEEERDRIDAQLASSGIPVATKRTPRAESVEVRGIPTARGIAIGPIYRLEDPLDLAHMDYTPNPDRRQEEADLLDAVSEARRELDAVRDELGERFGPEFAAVFNTHIQILEDKGFGGKLVEEVRRSGSSLEALKAVLEAYRETFGRIEDPFFRERVYDVEDVGRRVMERLLGVRHQIEELAEGSIVVAEHILPGHFARLDMEKVAAIVSEHGGSTSHGAIFARTLEIAAVTGATGILAAARPGETAIVDGSEGRIFLSPDEDVVVEYRRAQERYAVAVRHLDGLRNRVAETRDGRRIALTANVGLMSDLRLVEQHGAEGVGLFRTELLALVHGGFPHEEEQEQVYERVARALGSRPVTIRTLDLGGDKEVANLNVGREENPQLGCRSIRLALDHPEVFRAQARAILRASAYGNVRLLLPMISSVTELRRARAEIELAKSDLMAAGVPLDPEMPVGVMIEVPSAAIGADTLARECDFFSIGTNDLTQYTLAVDRGNERVAYLYDPLHPAVLCLIDRSVRAAERAGIPVSLCGEMASNPLAVPFLVGLGIGELSGTPSAVPVVKEIVRALDSSDARADVRAARDAGTVQEVQAIGAARLRRTALLDHPDIGPWLRRVVESVEPG